jgi:ribosome maturation protein Sdo1
MKTSKCAVVDLDEAVECLIEYYKTWIKSRKIEEILIENKHFSWPNFKDCSKNVDVAVKSLKSKEILEFLREKYDCDFIVLEHNDSVFLLSENVGSVKDEESECEEDYCDECDCSPCECCCDECGSYPCEC